MRTLHATLFRSLGAQLGEGPVWHGGALWLVDITAGTLHRLGVDPGADKSWKFDDVVSAVTPASAGRMLLVRRRDIGWFDPDGGGFERLVMFPESGHPARFNDAKCDAVGRLWAGTMALDAREGGCALYRVESSGAWQTMVEGLTCSNGLGWSPDNRFFYLIDTPTRRVDRFEFDAASGSIRNRVTLATFASGEGLPDGLTVDAEGHLWVALWGGGSVWRLHGETGARLARVVVPASQVTSCAFGGPELRSLFITTAGQGLSPEQRAREPLAGDVFRVDPGVEGLAAGGFAS